MNITSPLQDIAVQSLVSGIAVPVQSRSAVSNLVIETLDEFSDGAFGCWSNADYLHTTNSSASYN